jgi:hypothetical protein
VLDEDDDVGEMVLATAINETTGEPTDIVSTFDAGTTNIFAAIPIADAKTGDTFQFRWQGESDDAPVETQYTVTEEADRNWVYSELVTPDGLPAGAYTVEAYRQGSLVQARSFTVTE